MSNAIRNFTARLRNRIEAILIRCAVIRLLF
jgi:hypothetical protein